MKADVPARRCNLCGGGEWRDKGNRIAVECVRCGSLERTRAVKLVFERLGVPSAGSRILHFAPERGLAPWLAAVAPSGYDPVDIEPERYPHVLARKFDMVADLPSLPSNYYDLVLHMHVLEHVPCNIAPILYHLHRTLKPDGYHVFCIPPRKNGYYEEDFSPISRGEAERRFLQHDHVRAFGELDMDRHIGAIIRLPANYSLYDYASVDAIDQANIPEYSRTAFTGSAVFVTQKSDYLLGYPQ